MNRINKIFESIKLAVPALFAIFKVWELSTGNVTSDIVLVLIAIIAGIIGGSGLSRLRASRASGL